MFSGTEKAERFIKSLDQCLLADLNYHSRGDQSTPFESLLNSMLQDIRCDSGGPIEELGTRSISRSISPVLLLLLPSKLPNFEDLGEKTKSGQKQNLFDENENNRFEIPERSPLRLRHSKQASGKFAEPDYDYIHEVIETYHDGQGGVPSSGPQISILDTDEPVRVICPADGPIRGTLINHTVDHSDVNICVYRLASRGSGSSYYSEIGPVFQMDKCHTNPSLDLTHHNSSTTTTNTTPSHIRGNSAEIEATDQTNISTSGAKRVTNGYQSEDKWFGSGVHENMVPVRSISNNSVNSINQFILNTKKFIKRFSSNLSSLELNLDSVKEEIPLKRVNRRSSLKKSFSRSKSRITRFFHLRRSSEPIGQWSSLSQANQPEVDTTQTGKYTEIPALYDAGLEYIA